MSSGIKPPQWMNRREKKIFKQIPCWFEIDVPTAEMLAVQLHRLEQLHKTFKVSTFGERFLIIKELAEVTKSVIALSKLFGMVPKARQRQKGESK